MKNYNKWITLFLGPFGVHKYLAGEIPMGILYTLTGGLLGIGWMVDTIKAFLYSPQNSTPISFHKTLQALPVITPSGLILKPDELCHYQGAAHTEKTSSRIAGYTTQHVGGSVRIAKGMSIRSGGNQRRAVRETLTETSNGILYVTNKRLVFIATKNAFDKSLTALSAYVPNQGHITLLFGNQSFDLITSDAFRIGEIIDGILNGMSIEQTNFGS